MPIRSTTAGLPVARGFILQSGRCMVFGICDWGLSSGAERAA